MHHNLVGPHLGQVNNNATNLSGSAMSDGEHWEATPTKLLLVLVFLPGPCWKCTPCGYHWILISTRCTCERLISSNHLASHLQDYFKHREGLLHPSTLQERGLGKSSYRNNGYTDFRKAEKEEWIILSGEASGPGVWNSNGFLVKEIEKKIMFGELEIRLYLGVYWEMLKDLH